MRTAERRGQTPCGYPSLCDYEERRAIWPVNSAVTKIAPAASNSPR